MKNFTEFREEKLSLVKESELKDAYQDFFKEKLDEYDVDSPAELSDEESEKFFKEVKAEWPAVKSAL